MPRTIRFAALAALTALWGTGAGEAKAEDSAAIFDFYLSGIRAGEMQLRASETDGRYDAASEIRAAGVVGAFAKFFYDGEASGRVGVDGAVVPVRFVADSRSPRAERRTEIDWENGTPVSVSVVPPRSSAPDPEAQAGTLDPVSAGFRLLRDAPVEQICDATIDIFDGSRRSRLKLAAPAEKDGELTCAGTFARIEGEAHSGSKRREFPFEVMFRTDADGVARLQRIETSTQFGKAVVERRG